MKLPATPRERGPFRYAAYRVTQGLHALFPRVGDHEARLARDLLTREEHALFAAMQKRDQRHALAVARLVLRSGVEQREVLVAALLHDCGKGPVPVWMRTLFVVFRPAVELAGRRPAPGWRGAAYRLARHVTLSAELVERARSAGLTVRLVRGQVRPHEEHLLAVLRVADDAS